MSSRKTALLALIACCAMLALPSASLGSGDALKQAATRLGDASTKLATNLGQTAVQTNDALKATKQKTAKSVKKLLRHASGTSKASTRATAANPATEPPLHGSGPHAQGTIAVVDANPSSERPQGANPDGSDSGPEDIVVGRARGEQANGAFHGHITIAALLGKELLGVDSQQGEDKHGPLQPLQQNVLDPLCNNTAQQICLSVLTADSSTTSTGSTNHFAVAKAQLGGPAGIGVGAAESNGNITQDSSCQTSTSVTKTANVTAGAGAVASVANSASESKSCRGASPVVTNVSQVIGLGGVQVPLPAPGCANGTPDTVTGIPTVLPIVCNADDVSSASAVRDALDVFVLSAGTTSLIKETTASSESVSVAPPETGPQCNDGVDNDGDGLIDGKDPGCHTDGNANNAKSFDATGNNEAANNGGNGDNGGSGNGNGNNGSGNGGGGKAQCADKKDNDGDGLIDAKDPGCHSDGNANNASSYDAGDDSEADNSGSLNSGSGSGSGSLPFTGGDVLGIGLAGILMLGGGLLLRRKEDLLPR